MNPILQDNENDTALDQLKTQEKPLLAAVPLHVKVAQPSSLLQRFIDTGDSIFKDAAGAALNVLSAPVRMADNILSSHVHADNTSDMAMKDAIRTSTLSGIASNETGVVRGNKYSAVRTNTDGSKDLGKYQVNDATLKNLSIKYLGQQVTPAQFLADPNLQEMFANHRIANWMGQGYDKDHMASMWHHGASSVFNPDDPYVAKFDSMLSEK